MIGRIERVHLRDVWPHEAYNFTQWLQDNIEVLNEVLDTALTTPEREQSAGSFSVDLLAEDESGNFVIIENQLEKSDHDHLGKVITYLVAVDAKAAIWIVSDPRPEHINAITWLNETSAADFYLLKLEAIKIGESPPAPLLTAIVGPSEESREIGKTKKGLAERHKIRQQFWSQLLDKAQQHTNLHANISPSQSNWVGTGAGMSGLSLNYVIRQHDAQVELYIDRGPEAGEENKAIFDHLANHKAEIEAKFGHRLDWQRLEDKRACRIRKRLTQGGYRDEGSWDEIQQTMIQAMIRLSNALNPYLSQLEI
jgi:hypothetical protein